MTVVYLDPADDDPDVFPSFAGIKRARALIAAGGALHVIIDVDGCLTPGAQVVDSGGWKPVKVFGLDDRAAIERWVKQVEITLMTSDPCPATSARAKSLDCVLAIAPAEPAGRLHVIERYAGRLDRVVYIGDGYYDHEVMRGAGFGIAPSDAWPETLRAADAVVSRPGGQRAVALALDYIGEKLMNHTGKKEKVNDG
jgi:3-deoxy-D-manno-octulosonate 8-phosphate phosphatase (KDO 8-P phosphatase)